MVYVKYFAKKASTYFSILFIIAGIDCFVMGLGASGVIGIIIAIAISYGNIDYIVSNPLKYIVKWVPTQKFTASQNRINEALNEDTNLIRLEKEVKTAYYYGQDGEIYETTLKNCDCKDNKQNHIPCKHMYHLAHILGLVDYLNNDSSINTGSL